MILDFGCDPNVRGNLNQSILACACRHSSVSLVMTLIQECKADVNARDYLNYTPLSEAAYNENHEVALSLIREFGCGPHIDTSAGQDCPHI